MDRGIYGRVETEISARDDNRMMRTDRFSLRKKGNSPRLDVQTLTVDFLAPVSWCVPIRQGRQPALLNGRWYVDARRIWDDRRCVYAQGRIILS